MNVDTPSSSFQTAKQAMVGHEPDHQSTEPVVPKAQIATLPSASGKSLKNILGIIFLLIIVVGGVAGYWLTQQSQDVRQQALEEVVKPNAPKVTSPSDQSDTCYSMPTVSLNLDRNNSASFSEYRVWARIIAPSGAKIYTSTTECNASAWPDSSGQLNSTYTITNWESGLGVGDSTCSSVDIQLTEAGEYTLNVLVAGKNESGSWIEGWPTTVKFNFDQSCEDAEPTSIPQEPAATTAPVPTSVPQEPAATTVPVATSAPQSLTAPNAPTITGITPGGCYASLPDVFLKLNSPDNTYEYYDAWARILKGNVGVDGPVTDKLYTSGWKLNRKAWPSSSAFGSSHQLSEWERGLGSDNLIGNLKMIVPTSLDSGVYTLRALVAGWAGSNSKEGNVAAVSFTIDSTGCGVVPSPTPFYATDPTFTGDSQCQSNLTYHLEWPEVAGASSYDLYRNYDSGDWNQSYKTGITKTSHPNNDPTKAIDPIKNKIGLEEQMESGHQYGYAIIAKNSAGQSLGHSQVFSANCSTFLVAPEVDAKVECTSKTSVLISWNVTQEDESATNQYVIRKKVGDLAWNFDYKRVDVPNRSTTDTVTSGTNFYTVNAIRAQGGQAIFSSKQMGVNCDNWTPGQTVPDVGEWMNMCVNITVSPTPPTYGSTLTLTCANVAGATDYSFRYKFVNNLSNGNIDYQNSGGPYILDKIAGIVNQAVLHIEHTGTFTVECRACTNGTCPTTWPVN